MGAGRGRSLCALWGGISLGIGTLAFALFSPASVGCSTNLIVLTHSAVTARGCAAYSVFAHLGVGLIVLGAVLLLGSFALAVRNRRMAATASAAAPVEAGASPSAATPATTAPAPATTAPVPVEPSPATPVAVSEPLAALDHVPPEPVFPPGPLSTPEPPSTRTRPIAPGEGAYDDEYEDGLGLLDSAVRLPPGWYGNPNNPDKPVQWWDGSKLTDHPG